MHIETTYEENANYFVSLSNDTGNLISNLKLQKLVYYAQAWNLAVFKTRLFQADFQAWVHGPVVPALYVKYKPFQWLAIKDDAVSRSFHNEYMCSLSEEQQRILSEVVDGYFGSTAYELEQMTHNEDPWIKTRGELPADQPSSEVITDALMIEYYSQFLA